MKLKTPYFAATDYINVYAIGLTAQEALDNAAKIVPNSDISPLVVLPMTCEAWDWFEEHVFFDCTEIYICEDFVCARSEC